MNKFCCSSWEYCKFDLRHSHRVFLQQVEFLFGMSIYKEIVFAGIIDCLSEEYDLNQSQFCIEEIVS